jgi:hypothetical protein
MFQPPFGRPGSRGPLDRRRGEHRGRCERDGDDVGQHLPRLELRLDLSLQHSSFNLSQRALKLRAICYRAVCRAELLPADHHGNVRYLCRTDLVVSLLDKTT